MTREEWRRRLAQKRIVWAKEDAEIREIFARREARLREWDEHVARRRARIRRLTLGLVGRNAETS